MLNRIPATIRKTTITETFIDSSSDNRRQTLTFGQDIDAISSSSSLILSPVISKRRRNANVPLVDSQTPTNSTRRIGSHKYQYQYQHRQHLQEVNSSESTTRRRQQRTASNPNNSTPTINKAVNLLINTTETKSPVIKMAINLRQHQHIYYRLSISILVLVATMVTVSTSLFLTDNSVANKLTSLKVVPDLLEDSSLDLIRLEANGNYIKPGDMVPAKNFKNIDMNRISWTGSDSDRHTLLILDLDRKSGTNNSQIVYNQFTSINIPGHAINLGQALVAYEPPSVPCQPTMKHRILALACYQNQNIDIADIAYIAASTGQTKKRENFKLQQFLNKHQLTPVAANIFHAMGEANGVCSGSLSAVLNSRTLMVNFMYPLAALLVLLYGYKSIEQTRSK